MMRDRCFPSAARLLNRPWWTRLLTTALYFLALNWLMLVPSSSFEEVPDFLPHQDKLVHGGLFLALGMLVRWSLSVSTPGRPESGQSRVGWLAALLLYAGAIEALQPLLGGAGRQFDWLDMASNFAGVGGGWLLFGLVGGYHARRFQRG